MSVFVLLEKTGLDFLAVGRVVGVVQFEKESRYVVQVSLKLTM